MKRIKIFIHGDGEEITKAFERLKFEYLESDQREEVLSLAE